MAYDPNNIFAKILKGEIPSHKIYEDEDTLAFLDIMPRSEGHALVVTKTQATDLFDVDPKALAKLMAVVQKLGPKIKDTVGADGVLIQQFNGAAAGQTEQKRPAPGGRLPARGQHTRRDAADAADAANAGEQNPACQTNQNTARQGLRVIVHHRPLKVLN